MEAPHSKEINQVLAELKTDPEIGLSQKEVLLRQKKFGLNTLPKSEKLSRLKIFFGQFKSPLIYILVICSLFTWFLQKYTDTIVILAAVFVNTIVGFLQEYKANRALEKLRKSLVPKARVLRERKRIIIEAQNLVPGDIIFLRTGDRVPSDARLIEVKNLTLNEMPLTGESLPVKKHTSPVPESTPLADRENMVYMGTLVEFGEGKAVVVNTGALTELGKISELIKRSPETETPLKKRLSELARFIGILVLFLSFLIFLGGLISGLDPATIFITSIAITVASIPEGLPIAMTVILALGVQRILKRKGLIRKLMAAETLGSASVILTDKTATLTQGKMRLEQIITPTEIFLQKRSSLDEKSALLAGALVSNAIIENPYEEALSWKIQGDPTDRALFEAAIEQKVLTNEIYESYERISELHFDPVNKYLAKLYQTNQGSFEIFVAGAPEKVVKLCSFYNEQGEIQELTLQKEQKIITRIEKEASKGFRVIGLAKKQLLKSYSISKNFSDELRELIFLGLALLGDPLRKDVIQSMRICMEAGIQPVIITGDHKLTAQYIAKKLGLDLEKQKTLEGQQLANMTEQDLARDVKNIAVYARMEPEQKYKIVKAWQSQGEVVAMTGDGINDAPALKQADIGVVLGSGTDVAKEVADLILLDDSFTTIVRAIKEGRAIVDNIRKVMAYFLADSFTEITLIGGSMVISQLLDFPLILPISAAQILWVNIIQDGPVAMSLSFEPPEKGIMKRQPEKLSAPLLTREIKSIVVIISFVANLLLLGLFLWLLHIVQYPLPKIQTLIFATLTLDSLLYIFSCKSLKKNIWHINLVSNKFLLLSWALSLGVLISAVYLPPFNFLLGTVPLLLKDWLLVIGVSSVSLILIELVKWYFIKLSKKQV